MEKGNVTFGNYLKSKRINLKKTLRSFCNENNFDPGYVSRLENGLAPAPANKTKLEELAQSLGLIKESTEWGEFMDLASTSRNEFPEDILKDERSLRFLPAFYRTLRKKDITEEDIAKLLRIIKG